MTVPPFPGRTIVVMPTYNERDNLPRMISRLQELAIPGLSVLVVDDNSPDGTGRVADDLASQYPDFVAVMHRAGKQGLGTAYVAGFRWALVHGADYIVTMDADFSHPPETLLVFLDKIKEYDVVAGSRRVKGSGLDPHWGLSRRILSEGGALYTRLLTGLSMRDVTAGFRCFRRQVLEGIDLSKVRSEGFAFQIELTYACHRKGFSILEVPIYFQERAGGESKMSWKIVLEAFWRVLEMRTRL